MSAFIHSCLSPPAPLHTSSHWLSAFTQKEWQLIVLLHDGSSSFLHSIPCLPLAIHGVANTGARILFFLGMLLVFLREIAQKSSSLSIGKCRDMMYRNRHPTAWGNAETCCTEIVIPQYQEMPRHVAHKSSSLSMGKCRDMLHRNRHPSVIPQHGEMPRHVAQKSSSLSHPSAWGNAETCCTEIAIPRSSLNMGKCRDILHRNRHPSVIPQYREMPRLVAQKSSSLSMGKCRDMLHTVSGGWRSALWYSFLFWSLPVLRRWSSPLVASICSVWSSAWLCLGDWWGLLFGSSGTAAGWEMWWLQTGSMGLAILLSAKSCCRLSRQRWLHPLHLLGPVLLGCCRLQLTSLSSMIVLQPPLLCEGWGGHPLCLSGYSSVLMDLHWPCGCAEPACFHATLETCTRVRAGKHPRMRTKACRFFEVLAAHEKDP